MPYSGVPVENFGGLNLTDDPGSVGWSGAVDCLNVEFDQRGRIHSRDGYAKFTAAAPAAGLFHSLCPFYKTDGTKQLIAAFTGTGGGVTALNTSGAVVATQALDNTVMSSIARFAAPGSEHVYVASSAAGGNGTVHRWDGSAWSTPAWTGTTPIGRLLAVEASDNRLVNARYNSTTAGSNASTIRFSDAGTPTTWGANNYVDFSPGDGEEIAGLITWRDLVFAFKETKAAVFYGTSTDSSGNPIFNYRTIIGVGLPSAGGQTAYRALTAAPDGVYFANRRGIWFTTGGPARLVSSAVDPLFRGVGASSFWQSGYLNQAQIGLCALHWHDNRLYFAYPSGSATANDKLLVYDPAAGTWNLWNIPAAALCSFRVSNTEDLMFAYASGTNNVGRCSSSYTQDGGDGTTTGAAITSRYRSGFSDLGAPEQKTIREWVLDGIGSPTFQASHDFGALETGAAVTLGTSPATAEARYRVARRGRQFSWQIGGTTAWTLNNLTANVREKRRPGEHSSA